MKLLGSLSNRIFLASSLLAVLSVGAAIYVVTVQASAHAERELGRRLEDAMVLVEHYRGVLFDNLVRQARLIADLPRLKAAVELDDPPTVAPLAAEYASHGGADLFMLTNREGRRLGMAGRAMLGADGFEGHPALQRAAEGRESSFYWPHRDGVLQVVTVPIWIGRDRPEILGALSVGFDLDEALATRLRALTDSEIAFVADGQVQASTLRGLDKGAIAALAAQGPHRLWIGGEEYVGLSRPLSPQRVPSNAGDGGGDHAPWAIVLKSHAETLRFLRALHTGLGITAALAVLAAVLVSFAVARTITRPLGAITAAMRDMASTGDLTRRLSLESDRAWPDEDAALLASTFNTMTASIARFQRDATQRERLSSLGRLSTVIAHEIRNPLMIIKASLRALRRAAPPAEPVEAAIRDINGEVDRIDRILGGVLDFARPIRFDYGLEDVNALCESAAAAAAAGEGWPRVGLSLDRQLPPLRTDGERLRLVLVNIVTNARQAVIDRHGAPAEGAAGTPEPALQPDVLIATERARPEAIAITVTDAGVGIPPEDVPRVFEPFFTTRRSGSGLGLAIARNVVEGLGGTIGIESRREGGTAIRIELPVGPHVIHRQPGATTAA